MTATFPPPVFRTALAYGGMLLFALWIAVRLTGCASATEEARYTTALLRCVDKSETLAESRACRERVDGDFGVTLTNRKDAGR